MLEVLVVPDHVGHGAVDGHHRHVLSAVVVVVSTFKDRSLTPFYSVEFSQSRIGVKKYVFNKQTMKVCVSCC